jgi:mRNA-degrading endonuclease RelE of RelBE toxin-antitoxin system
MSFTIIVEEHCQKALRRIARADRALYQRFDKKILALGGNPYPAEVVVLRHTDEYDLCRVKVGRSWRIIYGVVNDRLVVLILDTVARGNAYEDLDLLAVRLERQLDDFDSDLESDDEPS